MSKLCALESYLSIYYFSRVFSRCVSFRNHIRCFWKDDVIQEEIYRCELFLAIVFFDNNVDVVNVSKALYVEVEP